MKKNDIALLILIVSISLVVSFFIAKAMIGTPESKPTKVEVVKPISNAFTPPDPDIFNDRAINPMQPITIGESDKPKPFGN